MIIHYFKMAFRSLMRYKTQNIVSIIGIAVGFVCFAFSMIWIRYELGYDNFHRGADRIYVLYDRSGHDFSGYSYYMRYDTSRELKNLFPEIEDAASFMYGPGAVGKTADENIEVMEITVDSSFVSIFDIRLIDGSLSFIDNESEVAITEEAAMRIFGTKDVIGKELHLYYLKKTKRISALVSGFGKHTNFGYDIMTGIDDGIKNSPYTINFNICFRINEGVDSNSLAEKLQSSEMSDKNWGMSNNGYFMEKLTSCHYTIYHKGNSISLMYIKLFSVIGVLVVLVSLVNFFSILVTRLNIRKREIALRVSCGSGMRSLTYMFITELFVIMSVSGIIGIVLMELFESRFAEMSGVTGNFYISSLFYFIVILFLSVCISFFIIHYYAGKSISEMLNHRTVKVRGNMTFQGGSLVLQLIISIIILFSLSVIFKQLYYLSNTEDVGFEREGRATIKIYPQNDDIIHFVKGLPYVYEVKKMYSLLPQSSWASFRVDSWDGKSDSQKSVTLHVIDEGQEFMDFYGLKLVHGSGLLEQGDLKSAIINETAVREFGWNEPIGKKFKDFTVVGVVKDFHISSPTLPVQPFVLTLQSNFRLGKDILVRYDENHEDDLRKEVERYFSKNNSSEFSSFTTMNDVYDKYLVSEKSLMKLLLFVSVVCVIISLFGVYSHVSLACERSRKEIAIRKINGARVGVIMNMFMNRYLYMLVLSCVIAFPIGTLLMKRWLEQYTEQTSIGVTLYIVVFISLLFLVLACIGRSIWRTANTNPAVVIKSE